MGPGYLGLNLNSLTTPILLGIYGMIMVTLILYDMAIGVITRYYVLLFAPAV